MKSLADIKRRAQVGVAMVMNDYRINGISVPGAVVGVEREVMKAQSNAIQFTPAPGREQGSWLFWPKAKEVTIFGPDEFEINQGDNLVMRYRFL